MSAAPKKEFTWVEGLAFCLSAIGIQLTSEATSQWGVFFYSPSDTGERVIYISIGLVMYVFVTGRIFDAVTDPLIGAWSDRTRTLPGWFRWLRPAGRRRPFIFWGSILMMFTFIGMWFPPVPGTSMANFYYALFIISLHWVFWTICVIPLNALLPEVARSQAARVKLGTWYAVGMVLGLALVEIALPIMVEALDPARAVVEAGEEAQFSPVGFQRTSFVLAAVALVFFQTVVWFVKERHQESAVTRERFPLRESIGALFNRPCLTFISAVFLQSIGLLAVQKALPYWAVLGLGGSEETVAVCMGPFILMVLITYIFIPALTRRFSLKSLMLVGFIIMASGFPLMYIVAVIDAPSSTKIALGAGIFGWCGIAQGLIYVLYTTMLGEVIDYDEQKTGRRREAVYWGFHGVSVKVGQALSIVLATKLMDWFGHSTDRPLGAFLVGPVGGIFAFAAVAALWFYPVLTVTKKTTEELLSSSPEG
ncbi:MAG: MFS transporter [bacterium]|nr:MFS transporter [bacterium]